MGPRKKQNLKSPIFLDTHIVVWLFAGKKELFSKNVIKLMNENIGNIFIHPIVILELEYLHEVGKVNYTSNQIISQLQSDIGLKIIDQDFAVINSFAVDLKWTRDVFDRLITSCAHSFDAGLITKDKLIRKHYKKAVW
ncbi:MAG: PIN domain-containing protein [Pseudomonadota bacterium]